MMHRNRLLKLAACALLVVLVMWPVRSFAQQPVGLFDGDGDVGSVKHAGSATYDPDAQQYTVTGSGANMWLGRDEFHFVWKRTKGDFILQARVKFLGQGVDPHRKMGWIVRAGLDADAPYVDVAVHGDGLTSLQFRRAAGDDTEEVRSQVTGADVVQLERKGTTYTMSVARFGEPLVTDEVTNVALGGDVYVGLFVCAHNPDVVEQAVFDNVQIVVPSAKDFVPYRDYIGSNLEVLDVATGHRTVVYRSAEALQAPNWTRDGQALVYNAGGRLYRFDLATRSPEVIDTGFATSNNNDHVLSPDGRLLGISSHDADDGNRSIVYVVPLEGGTPRQVTPTGPSYLHGWSPDGRELVYVGERNGEFDLYKIPVDGGDEVRLTTAPGLDDGPEFTPDGKTIFFNSSRSGRMQIWRMKPDGSDQRQVTDDQFNDWFPHVSPDGRQMVSLSFASDVAPDDHPFYKQVYLRMMPVEGGEPTAIAYVYGGQGTINVPSWSPDGKRLAFVSNTAGN
jgi:TolB protein